MTRRAGGGKKFLKNKCQYGTGILPLSSPLSHPYPFYSLCSPSLSRDFLSDPAWKDEGALWAPPVGPGRQTSSGAFRVDNHAPPSECYCISFQIIMHCDSYWHWKEVVVWFGRKCRMTYRATSSPDSDINTCQATSSAVYTRNCYLYLKSKLDGRRTVHWYALTGKMLFNKWFLTKFGLNMTLTFWPQDLRSSSLFSTAPHL